ncbi:hypothetical protein NBRC116599_15710 [Aquicoccus sp. SU-CL01552]
MKRAMDWANTGRMEGNAWRSNWNMKTPNGGSCGFPREPAAALGRKGGTTGVFADGEWGN